MADDLLDSSTRPWDRPPRLEASDVCVVGMPDPARGNTQLLLNSKLSLDGPGIANNRLNLPNNGSEYVQLFVD